MPGKENDRRMHPLVERTSHGRGGDRRRQDPPRKRHGHSRPRRRRRHTEGAVRPAPEAARFADFKGRAEREADEAGVESTGISVRGTRI